MASWLRILVWIAVAVLPGGMLLIPVLLADAVRRRQALKESVSSQAAAY
jgi:hypothetical protein